MWPKFRKKPRHCAWVVSPGYVLKPTKLSADRLAQKLADAGYPDVYYYPASARRRALQRKTAIKVVVVYSKETKV